MPIACTTEVSISLILKGKLDHTFVEQQLTHFGYASNVPQPIVIRSLFNSRTLTNLADHFLSCPHITGVVCAVCQIQHHSCEAHFYPIYRVPSTSIIIVTNRCARRGWRSKALTIDAPIGTFGTAIDRSPFISPLSTIRISTQSPSAAIISKSSLKTRISILPKQNRVVGIITIFVQLVSILHWISIQQFCCCPVGQMWRSVFGARSPFALPVVSSTLYIRRIRARNQSLGIRSSLYTKYIRIFGNKTMSVG